MQSKCRQFRVYSQKEVEGLLNQLQVLPVWRASRAPTGSFLCDARPCNEPPILPHARAHARSNPILHSATSSCDAASVLLSTHACTCNAAIRYTAGRSNATPVLCTALARTFSAFICGTAFADICVWTLSPAAPGNSLGICLCLATDYH